MATQTTNYNFPLTDDATTTFSAWWQLINGDNSSSLAYMVDDALHTLQVSVSAMANLHFVAVNSLPTQDIETNAIYLVPNSGSGTNVKDEYIYYNNNWEKIGTTDVDLSGYVTKTGSESMSNKTITSSTYNGYSLAAACAKGVDSTISDTSSTDLPTSKAVCDYITSYMSTNYADADVEDY